MPPQAAPVLDREEDESVDEIVNIDDDLDDDIDDNLDDNATNNIDNDPTNNIDNDPTNNIDNDPARDTPPAKDGLPVTGIDRPPTNNPKSNGKETHSPRDAPQDEQQPQAQPVPQGPVNNKKTESAKTSDTEPIPELEEETAAPVVQQLPFTFWVEGFVIFVLADPIFVDDEMLTGGTYQWEWGDGTVSRGGLFQTHHYAQGPDSYTVTMTRFNDDGDATHEYTIEIDLIEFLYEDPQHVFESTQPLNVQSTTPPRPPTVESDVGQLIATVPVGPLPLFLLSALGMLAGLRRRLTA